MKLNTAYYGTEHGTFWYNDRTTGRALTAYIEDGNPLFVPTFAAQTYNGVPYSNGQLSYMAKAHIDRYSRLIDNSICYAAIPANSPIAHVSYLNRTSSYAGRYEAYAGDIPLFLSIGYNKHSTNANSSMGAAGDGNGFLPNRWATWTQSEINDIGVSKPTGGKWMMPLSKYNYNDIVLLIKVAVGSDISDPTSYTTVDLGAWDKTTHPYLYCCYGVPYVGKAGSRFNLNGAVDMVYDVGGTVTTFGNYLRVCRNIEMLPPPNYHNGDVNDYPAGRTPIINYDSSRWLNIRTGYTIGTYGCSIGCCNSSVTPNSSLDTFTNTGSIDGDAGIYIISGDDSVFSSFAFTSSSRVVTVFRDDVDVRKLMSWYGLQFVDTLSKTQAEIGSADLCVPIISYDGYTTGDYRTGAEALELPNANWQDKWDENNGYDGSASEQFDMVTELRPQNGSAASPFTYQYILNDAQIRSLKDYLYTTVTTDTDETELFQKFLTNNPVDCITSLTVFPFNVADYAAFTAGEHVIMGNVDTGITAPAIYTGMVIVVDAGSVMYKDRFSDFRSFEPYCDAEIQIPYHGSVHISPSEYVGHEIGVKYVIDICSGASIALIFRDGLAVDSIAGQIGGTLTLTGIQAASYHNAVYSSSSGYKQAKTSQLTQAAGAVFNVASNLIQGNLAGAAASLMSGISGAVQQDISADNAEYKLNHVQIPYKQIGSNTTFTSMGNEQYCRLIIKRPMMDESYVPSIYGKTQGFACCITAKLSTVSGYTVVAAADLSGLPISAQEKSMLLKILQSGFYM